MCAAVLLAFTLPAGPDDPLLFDRPLECEGDSRADPFINQDVMPHGRNPRMSIQPGSRRAFDGNVARR